MSTRLSACHGRSLINFIQNHHHSKARQIIFGQLFWHSFLCVVFVAFPYIFENKFFEQIKAGAIYCHPLQYMSFRLILKYCEDSSILHFSIPFCIVFSFQLANLILKYGHWTSRQFNSTFPFLFCISFILPFPFIFYFYFVLFFFFQWPIWWRSHLQWSFDLSSLISF